MASGFVRAGICHVLERPEYEICSTRSEALLRVSRRLLEVIVFPENLDKFDSFAYKHYATIDNLFPKTVGNTIKQRESLARKFHIARIGKLADLWNELLSDISVEQNSLLEQHVNQYLFDNMQLVFFNPEGHGKASTTCRKSPLTRDEENMMRYVAGYIPFKLIKVYECQRVEYAADFVECLSHMSVPGDGTTFSAYSTKWIEKINRGGLFEISEEVHTFFCFLETEVKEVLP